MSTFDDALQALARAPKDSDLPDLLTIFTDQCEHHEVMWGLVHFIESFEMKTQLAALIDAVPSMSVHAAEWTRILHCRILNDDISRECYKELLQAASPGSHEAVKAVLMQIQVDDENFSSRVRQLVA
ncbi:MAG: hypothetical protein K2R98_09100 [Gemmataceae bacterium]|nr:hypothetical protein [Gemmataceae bacterium]